MPTKKETAVTAQETELSVDLFFQHSNTLLKTKKIFFGDHPVLKNEMPEGAFLWMRGISQKEKEQIDDMLIVAGRTDTESGESRITTLENFQASMLQVSVVSGENDNTPKFTLEQINKMASIVFTFLYKKAQELSGIDLNLKKIKGN